MFTKFVQVLREIKEGSGSFLELPDAFWDSSTWAEDFYLELIRFHHSAISKIPVDKLTEEMAVIAIKNNPLSLQHIPEHFKTLDLCRLATGSDVGAINYVPNVFFDALLEAWKRRGPDDGDILKLPASILTNDFWMEMIRLYPEMIEYIPNKQHSDEICKSFIDGFGYLEDIPWANRSRNLCIVCLKNGHAVLNDVPRLLWGDDILEAHKIGESIKFQ